MTVTPSSDANNAAITPRNILEPIGQLRPGALGAQKIAEDAWKLIYAKGRMQISMDSDGCVYVTPADHPFSKSMLRQYSDRIVGTYSVDASVEDILGDLIEQWRTDREAAA